MATEEKKIIAPLYTGIFHILLNFERKHICVYLISSWFRIVCEKKGIMKQMWLRTKVGEGHNEFKNTAEICKKVIQGRGKKGVPYV